MILGGFDKLKPGYLVAGLLFIGALPWLFSIDERPLVITPKSELVQKSILETTRQELYFVNAPSERDRYIQLTDIIKSQGCKDIGLMLKGMTQNTYYGS